MRCSPRILQRRLGIFVGGEHSPLLFAIAHREMKMKYTTRRGHPSLRPETPSSELDPIGTVRADHE